MKAIQFSSYDGPQTLEYVDAPKPVAAADEVLVKIHAAGVNPVDIHVSQGHLKDFMPLTLPAVAGGEVSGIVEAVGADVTGFKVGDAVQGNTGISGAFAEYIAMKTVALAQKPKNLSFEEAAALPVAVATATVALDAGNVGQGTTLLVHAAAGGVGSVAVQLAKARGAHVTALASAGNLDFVKSLGADKVVDRATRYEDELKDFDVVLDAFGPEAQERSWSTLKKGGILVSLVAAPSEETAAKHGVRATMIYGTPSAKTLAHAVELAEAGKLKTFVSKTYPLREAKQALDEIATGKVRGKLIIKVA